MNGQKLIRIIPLASTLVFIAVTIVPGLVPYQPARFLIILTYLVFAPGVLIGAALAPGMRGFGSRLAAALVFGAAADFAMLTVIALARIDVAVLQYLVPAVTVALAVFAPMPGPQGATRHHAAGRSAAAAVAVAAAVIVTALMLAGGGDPVAWTSDSPDHISWLRMVASTGEAFPDGCYYGTAGTITRDIRKGLLHSLVGAADRMTGASDPLAAWNLTAWLSAVLLIAVLFNAASALLESPAAGAAAVVLLVLADRGGLAGNALLYTATGFGFGSIFYIAMLAVLPDLFARPRRVGFAIAAAAAWAATGAHVAYFVIAVFALVAFWLSTLYARGAPGRRETLIRTIPLLAVIICAISAPYLAMRYLRDYAPDNPLHTSLQGVLFLPGGSYVLNPIVLLRERGALAPLALAAVLLLRGPSRCSGPLRLLRHGLAAWYLLVFVPLWFPAVDRALSYLLIRMESVVPSTILCAALVTLSWRRLRGGRVRMSAAAAVTGIVLTVLLAGPPVVRSVTRCAWTPSARARHADESARSLGDLYRYIDSELPAGGVIVSDPVTSYSIPAFTDQFAACPLDQHSTPNDSTAVRRLRDCREVFMDVTDPVRVASIMERYGSRYVLANGLVPPRLQTMYWRADRRSAADLARRLEGSSLFSTLWRCEGASLHRLDRAPERREDRPASVPSAGSVDRAAAVGMTPSGLDGILVESIEIPDDPVARGESFDAVVTWVALRDVGFGSYQAHIRFDTGFGRGPLYRPAWGKPYRKLLERLRMERYRFRRDFQPLGGIYPPDTWTPLSLMSDTVRVGVPADIAPGRYAVSVRLERRTHYPNYRLSDMLRDDDSFSGETLSWIVVK